MRIRLALAAVSLASACATGGPQDDLDRSTVALGIKENGCTISDVIDGDTVRVSCIDGSSRNARLVGFDTPEIFSAKCAEEKKRGLAAKQTLANLIDASREMRASPVRDTDKYGRLLFRLYLDGKDVADSLVERGLARRYDGGKRKGWCGIPI